jgi:uncharacterized membrane protein
MGAMARLRAYFIAGILITAPISITFYIAWIIVSFVDGQVARVLPQVYNPNTYLPFSIPGLGIVIVLVSLTMIGWITAGLLGRMFIRISEAVLARMPVVRSVYSAVKQIFETILAERATTFRQVVLIQFPRLGLWRYAFVTTSAPEVTQRVTPGGLISVYIPNTPNATAGFLVMVPASDLVPVDLTVEEAMKLVVSAGIATPGLRNGKAPPGATRNGAT